MIAMNMSRGWANGSSSAQIPNQNSSANHQNEAQQSDELCGLSRQVNPIASNVINPSSFQLPARNSCGKAVALPTAERNNRGHNTPDIVTRNLQDTLKDYLDNSLENACWHRIRLIGLDLMVCKKNWRASVSLVACVAPLTRL